jgi:hypothetical protein
MRLMSQIIICRTHSGGVYLHNFSIHTDLNMSFNIVKVLGKSQTLKMIKFFSITNIINKS